MLKKAIVPLFFVGLLAACALGGYVLSGLMFVFGDSENPEAVAFMPKWIFFLSPLVLLGKRREVKNFGDRLGDVIFR